MRQQNYTDYNTAATSVTQDEETETLRVVAVASGKTNDAGTRFWWCNTITIEARDREMPILAASSSFVTSICGTLTS